jgi:hypothetical protein
VNSGRKNTKVALRKYIDINLMKKKAVVVQEVGKFFDDHNVVYNSGCHGWFAESVSRKTAMGRRKSKKKRT